ESFRDCPEQAAGCAATRVVPQADQAAEHALAVRLENRQALLISLGKDGSGHVPAGAGGVHKAGTISGDYPSLVAGAQPRGGMEVVCATVVAEALPKSQHILFIRRRQMADGRQGVYEADEERDDRGRLGLLEHYFAHPDAIWISILTPGKLPEIPTKPLEK